MHFNTKQSGSPLSDITSFKIGFALYAEANLNIPSLLRKLYNHRNDLNHYNLKDGTYYTR
jgi:hypothetical protein